jgi:hypothetical protein
MYGGAWLAIVARVAIRLPILAACAWLGASACVAQTDPETRFVLLLYSSDQTLPATNIVGAEVLKELDASTAPKVEVRSDFLDMSRFKYPAYRDDLAAFLAKKYAGAGIDLVVALGPPALDFIATYREQVAPGAKIVFGLVSEPELAESRLPKGEVSGIVSDYDVAKTLQLAIDLQPEARRIVVASGSLPYDLRLEARAREALAPLADRYAITYLSDLPFDEVLTTVAALPRDTIVLVLSYFRDATGRRFVPREAGSCRARPAARLRARQAPRATGSMTCSSGSAWSAATPTHSSRPAWRSASSRSTFSPARRAQAATSGTRSMRSGSMPAS